MKHQTKWRGIPILLTVVLIGVALTLSSCRNNSEKPAIMDTWNISLDRRTVRSIDGDVIKVPNGVYFLGCTETVLLLGKEKFVDEHFHFKVNGAEEEWQGRQMIIGISDTRTVILTIQEE